ncbi:PASTA domain-containing protein [Sphingobacterium sp. T2]|uniref:PASTA domain-containing protein n=1 Tax=Sphingobacterium sp. T2 TaxID=1590596 RepID=UPI0029352100|nr:PASTA domain-containing protein [Sphingobacterium sp. T2]
MNWNSISQGDSAKTQRGVPFIEAQIKEGVVPNVKGMGLADAIFTMENAGFKTKVLGKGKVIAQSLAPGQRMKIGTNVVLELN